MAHFILFPGRERLVKIDPGKGETHTDEIPEPVRPFEHDENTSEGSEYLDDALRMKEQPFGKSDTSENE